MDHIELEMEQMEMGMHEMEVDMISLLDMIHLLNQGGSQRGGSDGSDGSDACDPIRGDGSCVLVAITGNGS